MTEMTEMTQKIFRVGIAGYGVVGHRRRTHIDAHPALQTVAVCDRKYSENGVFEDGVQYFMDYKRLIKADIDVLFVCMTNDIAPEVTIAGLERGVHVFCEKPPGRNVEDITKVIACERKCKNLKLKYGFNHRYHDSVRDALRLIRSGAFGRIINLKGTYGKSRFVRFGEDDWRTNRDIAGGGILLDQGIHMVDLMRLFAGDFSEIHSYISNDFWSFDVEDNAYALMRTEAGVIAFLHSSATQWRHRFQLEIALEKGAIALSGILSGSKSYGAETMTVAWAADNDEGDPKEQTTSYNADNSWADEVDDFATAIISDTAIVDGSSSEALMTMDMVYRIYCADPEWGQKWKLKPLSPEWKNDNINNP